MGDVRRNGVVRLGATIPRYRSSESSRVRPPTRRVFVVIVVLALASIVSACGGSDEHRPAAAPSATAPRPVQVPSGELQARLQQLIQRSEAPGALAGVVVRGGTPTLGAVGIDPHTQARLTTTDRFRIESLTKTFVGALALQLVQQGRMHLDDPVSTYVSDWPRGDEITIRMLLSHTSGIPPWGGDGGGHDMYSDAADQFARAHYGKTVTPQEVLAVARTRPLLFDPGTRTSYSNINTILLGQIVAQLTGQGIGDALHRSLLDPLHLTSTSYAPTEPTTAIGGYTDLTGNGTLVDTGALDWTGDVSTTGAAGGMVSTVPDLLTWGNTFLRERTVVKDPLANDAFSIQPGGTGLGVLGFDHEQFFCVFADSGCTVPAKFTTIGGSGAGPGVRTIVAYNRDTDAVAVVMVNRDGTPGIEEFIRDVFDDVGRLEQTQPATSS